MNKKVPLILSNLETFASPSITVLYKIPNISKMSLPSWTHLSLIV